MLFTLLRRLELLTPRAARAVLPALGAVALCIGCSSSEDGDSDAAAGATGTGGDTSGSGGESSTSGGSSSGGSVSVEEDPAVGTFSISVDPTSETTNINGGVRDAPQGEAVIWELTMEDGGCRLVEPRVPFCDPACTGSAICVEDDVCREDPPRRNVGDVTITGLQTTDGGTEVVLQGIGTAPQYNVTAGTSLNYPPFAEGDPVVLSATGQDDIPAFQIESQGISPLQMITTGDVSLETGQPLSLQWTPPSQADVSTIRAVVDISHHGGQKGEIICDVPDTGSLDIPAALATRLLELGYSGYPDVSVERRAVGSTNIATGRVDLKVVSRQDLSISIPGLTSCPTAGETTGCPAGQTCQDDLKCG